MNQHILTKARESKTPSTRRRQLGRVVGSEDFNMRFRRRSSLLKQRFLRHNPCIMAIVHFTSHLASFVNSDPTRVDGDTVGAALAAALAGREQLRTYILDDQGRLRRHVMLFIDGQMVVDRLGLSEPVTSDSEVYVMQALSGG